MSIIHEVKYYTRKSTADARARCTCGWFTFGTLDECVDAAKVHNDWQEVVPEPAKDIGAPYGRAHVSEVGTYPPSDKITILPSGGSVTASVTVVDGVITGITLDNPGPFPSIVPDGEPQ